MGIELNKMVSHNAQFMHNYASWGWFIAFLNISKLLLLMKLCRKLFNDMSSKSNIIEIAHLRKLCTIHFSHVSQELVNTRGNILKEMVYKTCIIIHNL